MKLELPERFSKNTQISNFVKIHPMGAELFHADGRADMAKLRAAFRNFANLPKNHAINITAT
jgi:hypothetical protein